MLDRVCPDTFDGTQQEGLEHWRHARRVPTYGRLDYSRANH